MPGSFSIIPLKDRADGGNQTTELLELLTYSLRLRRMEEGRQVDRHPRNEVDDLARVKQPDLGAETADQRGRDQFEA